MNQASSYFRGDGADGGAQCPLTTQAHLAKRFHELSVNKGNFSITRGGRQSFPFQ
jgi:hypothetical protein